MEHNSERPDGLADLKKSLLRGEGQSGPAGCRCPPPKCGEESQVRKNWGCGLMHLNK